MLATESRTIDGVTFRVTQLPFTRSRRMFVLLAKSLGPALVNVLDDTKSIQDLKSSAGIAGMLHGLISNLEDDKLEAFADAFGDSTEFSRDGNKWPRLDKANREAVFAGSLLRFFHWLRFCCEVNYADFFVAAGNATGGVPASGELPAE